MPVVKLVTAAQLQIFAPRCDFLVMGPAINAACEEFEISTPRRLKHFLGQLHHESSGLTRLEEDLTYTSAARICEVWPKRFPTIDAALPFVRNPRALANKVYGGRLGNTGPDDGWRFRGGGLIMNTGLANYRDAGEAIGVDLVAQPELLRQPKIAALAAGAFWARKNLNELADQDNAEAVSLRVNGGRNGLPDRLRQTQRAGLIWREAA